MAVRIIGLGAIFLLLLSFLNRPVPVSRENFNIINEPQYVPVPLTNYTDTGSAVLDNLEADDSIDGRMAKKNKQLANNAKIADYGVTKSRGNIMRKMFGKDMDYNEDIEWWNDRD